MDVLIIRPGALGDSILTLPVLHALRLAGARNIKVLGTPASWGFLRPGLKHISLHDFGSRDCLGLFQAGVAVAPGLCEWLKNVSSAIVFLPGDTSTVQRTLRSLGIREVVYCIPPVDQPTRAGQVHAAHQLLSGLPPWISEEQKRAALAINFHDDDEFIRLDAEEIQAARAMLQGKINSIAIHPGSGGLRKCWPATRYASLATELATRHQLHPLVFSGPADDKVRAEFERSVSPTLPLQWIANKTLREVLALLTFCRFYIGNDSGISHLAARACRSVVLFGPTDPSVWSPIGKNTSILKVASGSLDELRVVDVINKLIEKT